MVMKDCLPSGIRVLLADSDLTSLNNLEKMFKKCDYKEVTTCSSSEEALRLLQESKDDKDGFDMVICDAKIPDLVVSDFLTRVAVEMDFPVIVIVDGGPSKVMKFLQHGACVCLHKPVNTREIQALFQHVVKKQVQRGREPTNEITPSKENADSNTNENAVAARPSRKRKDIDAVRDDSDSSSTKRRVVWTAELHQKFINAVGQIGDEKVGPKKILDLMKVDWLTRENVASHLQKYRLGLQKKEKEKNLGPMGMNHSDNLASPDGIASFDYQPLIIQPESYSVPRQHMITENDCSPITNPAMVPLNSVFKQEYTRPHFISHHYQLEQLQLPSSTRQADINLSYGNQMFYAQQQIHPTNYTNINNNNPCLWSIRNPGLNQSVHNRVDSPLRNLAVIPEASSPSGSMRNLAVGPEPSSPGVAYPFQGHFLQQNHQNFVPMDSDQDLIDALGPAGKQHVQDTINVYETFF